MYICMYLRGKNFDKNLACHIQKLQSSSSSSRRKMLLTKTPSFEALCWWATYVTVFVLWRCDLLFIIEAKIFTHLPIFIYRYVYLYIICIGRTDVFAYVLGISKVQWTMHKTISSIFQINENYFMWCSISNLNRY